MKTKLLILFLLISTFAAGQSIVPLKGDSVVISKTGSWAELVVRNRTKDSLNGVAINTGNGVIQFKRISAINDSQFVVGTDTIKLKGVGVAYTFSEGVYASGTSVKGDSSYFWTWAHGKKVFDSLAPLWTQNWANTNLNLTGHRTHEFGDYYSKYSFASGSFPFSEYYFSGNEFAASVVASTRQAEFRANVGGDDNSTTAILRANGTAEAYLLAKADGSLTFKGDLIFSSYTTGHTGTVYKQLAVDASGNVILTDGAAALPTMTFTDGGVGFPFLNLYDDTTAVIKDVKDSIFTKWVSHDLYNVSYDDTAAMRSWILTFALASSDTSNLLFDTIPGGTSLPTAIFQVGDSILRTRGFGDSVFTKFSINGAGVLVGRTDTAAMRTWILTFASGGGGGTDANAHHNGGDAWAAYATFGNNSNFGIGIKTNNTLRGRIDSIGTFLWAGASAQVSATAGTYYKANFGDTSHFTAIRLGGASQLTGTVGANALLSIKSAGSGATSLLSVFSGVTAAPVFNVNESGLVGVPMLLNAWSSTLFRAAGANLTISAANGGAFSNDGVTISTNTAYASVAATNRAIFAVAGSYTSGATAGQTGIVSAMHLISNLNQTAGATNPSAALTININKTALADYKAIRIIDNGDIYTNGGFEMTSAANARIKIATGSNSSVGTATLASGTVTVNTTAVTTNSLIFIQATSNSSLGYLYISAKSAATSFTVTSTSGSDASTFNYWIIN